MFGETMIRSGAALMLAGIWAVDWAWLQHRELDPTRDRDSGSSRAWDYANAIQVLGVVVGFTPIGRIADSTALQAAGIATMIAGIALRWHAMRTLGRLFTGTVSIREGHRLVRIGPYARLRHPAYAGSLVWHLGLGFAFANWLTLLASTLPYAVAVVYRIRVEERALAAAFGTEYDEYARTADRILPWIY